MAGRQYAQFWDDHHGDGMVVLWCAAPEGAQAMLLEAEPGQYFVPPCVGRRGWLGARLDRRPDWRELAGIGANAHATVGRRASRA